MKTMREDVVEMNYHVSIKEIPERTVASVKRLFHRIIAKVIYGVY